MPEQMGPALTTVLTVAAVLGSTIVVFIIGAITSLFIVAGLARRDHADRSIEFWLSLPTSHVRSLAVPLVVHLLLVPAAALLVGLLGGYVISLLLVSRVSGFGAWLGLPWGELLSGTVAVALRLLAGLPMAVLWLLPLILLVVLSTALFKRWGVPILVLVLSVGAALLQYVFGAPMLARVVGAIGRNAAQAMLSASGNGITVDINSAEQAEAALRSLPAWAAHDLAVALQALASPLFLAGLVFAAACFAALVECRRRGAGAAG